MRLTPEQTNLLKAHSSFQEVLKIAFALKNNGNDCFIVGGGVRDLLLGVTPKDLDLVSDAKPDEVKQIFPNALPIGEAFGIMVLPTQQGPIELATFRKESAYTDGRHPEQIEYSDMSEDSKRRDFTVNSLYLNILTYEITDLQNGIADLKAKTLRTVGPAKNRFTEDRLRLLRLARFAIQLNFSIEHDTLKGAQSLNGELKGVSAERIREEVLRSLQSNRATSLPQLLHEIGLSKPIVGPRKFSELKVSDWRNLENVCELSIAERLFLFLWAHDVTGHDALEWLRRYKMPKEIIGRVSGIHKEYSDILEAAKKNGSSKKLFKGNIFRRLILEPSDFLFYFLQQNKTLQVVLDEFKIKFLRNGVIGSLLTSKELMEIGVKPGPQFGEILNRGFEAQLEFGLKTSEEIKNWLKTNGLL